MEPGSAVGECIVTEPSSYQDFESCATLRSSTSSPESDACSEFSRVQTLLHDSLSGAELYQPVRSKPQLWKDGYGFISNEDCEIGARIRSSPIPPTPEPIFPSGPSSRTRASRRSERALLKQTGTGSKGHNGDRGRSNSRKLTQTKPKSRAYPRATRKSPSVNSAPTVRGLRSDRLDAQRGSGTSACEEALTKPNRKLKRNADLDFQIFENLDEEILETDKQLSEKDEEISNSKERVLELERFVEELAKTSQLV